MRFALEKCEICTGEISMSEIRSGNGPNGATVMFSSCNGSGHSLCFKLYMIANVLSYVIISFCVFVGCLNEWKCVGGEVVENVAFFFNMSLPQVVKMPLYTLFARYTSARVPGLLLVGFVNWHTGTLGKVGEWCNISSAYSPNLQ